MDTTYDSRSDILLGEVITHLQKYKIVSAGFEPLVDELIGAGADVKAANDKGITVL